MGVDRADSRHRQRSARRRAFVAACAIAVVRSGLRRARKRRHGVARRELEHRDYRWEGAGRRCDRRRHRFRGHRSGDRDRRGRRRSFARGRLLVFGPNRSGGRLESSKIFAKRFMERHGVPTARAAVVHSLDGANKALDDWKSAASSSKPTDLPPAKASSCARCRGSPRGARRLVYGTIASRAAAPTFCWRKGSKGVKSAFLRSCDGRAMVPIAAACDYKRAGDGDTGPNTGGMGAYSPPHGFPDDLVRSSSRTNFVADAARTACGRRRVYRRPLLRLDVDDDGPTSSSSTFASATPKLKCSMPRIGGDFCGAAQSAADGAMDLSLSTLSAEACVGIVFATPDYPRSSTPLSGLNGDVTLPDGCRVFWGASQLVDGTVNTAGGRVLTVMGLGNDLAQARSSAYAAVKAALPSSRHQCVDLSNGYRGAGFRVTLSESKVTRRI